MKVMHIGENNSVLNSFIAELRDSRIQKDSMRFRTNLERVGEVFAYEISKTLEYSEKDVITPLGVARVSTPDTQLVIGSILRAGLPIQEGMLRLFDHAETAFLSAYRNTGKGGYFKVKAKYCTTPSLEGKTLILADALLATGASMEVGMEKLREEGGGDPARVHLVCPVASRAAVDHLCQVFGPEYTLWVAAIDEELTSQSYIVPGIGDAGDLAFGGKL
ncbi:MAG: uracil phosphoribosyltransferase [Bacteroidales bacterium]|nr:uracil phosphoribosyltransferase [Bacteroidales bacterium]